MYVLVGVAPSHSCQRPPLPRVGMGARDDAHGIAEQCVCVTGWRSSCLMLNTPFPSAHLSLLYAYWNMEAEVEVLRIPSLSLLSLKETRRGGKGSDSLSCSLRPRFCKLHLLHQDHFAHTGACK